ncbi:MAG: DUF6062 family protein [Bacillota bacterium]
MNTSFDGFFVAEIKHALEQEGCPLCRLGREAEDRYLFFFLHEHMNSLPIYEFLAKGGRLCHHHAWLAFDRASGGTGLLGTAVLYDHMAALLADDLRQALESSRGKAGVLDRLSQRLLRRKRSKVENPQFCWICRSIAGTEDTFLHYLCKHLEDNAGMKEIYAMSDGLCIPHLKAAFARASPSVGFFLLDKAVSDLERLKSQLQEYQRKNDYRFHHETWGDEKTSPERMVRLCVGPRASPVSSRRDRQSEQAR